MFGGAVVSLVVAVVAALVGYGGLPDATLAAVAQHVFLIGMGLFVVSAVVAILDLQLPQLQRSLLVQVIRGGKVNAKSPSYSDMV